MIEKDLGKFLKAIKNKSLVAKSKRIGIHFIPINESNIEKLQLMPFLDTLLGAVKMGLAKTSPLHGAN